MNVVTSSVEVITLLDVDYSPGSAFRVVQLTPPGSNCSIQIGNGVTEAAAGSLSGVYLVVTDIEAARRSLLERGVQVGEIRHKTPPGAWDGGFAPGLDPARGDYASVANFSDPDGNGWVLQERGYRRAESLRLANQEHCETHGHSAIFPLRY
jgi:hypothetical protein